MTVTSHKTQSSRLTTHYLDSGGSGAVVVFVHGNVSSSAFFHNTLERLPNDLRGLAVDLRGFGQSEALPVDATRGLRDFSEDLHSFFSQLGLADQPLFLVGWSAGGGIVMQYAIDHPRAVAGLVLSAPMSPYGFGGTRGLDGAPCWSDCAGSGAGIVNAEFIARLGKKDRGSDSQASPRNVMNSFYFKPPFRLSPEEEERGLSAILETCTGDDNYPGDAQKSANWPGLAPGTRGINNAVSPKYCNLSGFAGIHPKPKVLWIRGAEDRLVSDTSLFDFGMLGQLGVVPGWPGADQFPAQPMVGQLRAVLDAYRKNGGQYDELVFADCGHSPHLEKPAAFEEALRGFVL